jgi:uncharacterized membrane protein YheB (UPF0754 family)
MNWLLVFIPLISAFIGWIIMRLAVKMLFHPLKPKKFLGFVFQGVLPKRQPELAVKIGKLAGTGLLSFADLEQKVANADNVEKLMPVLEEHIDHFLRVKLTQQIPMLGMLIGDKTIGQVKAVFITELKELFPVLMKQYMGQLQSELNLEKIVTEKVTNLAPDKLDIIFSQILSTELRRVEVIGAVVGFTIGILQILLTLATIK